MLKVWGRINSVNVEKVIWTAQELGLPFERIEAGGAFGVVDTPEFRARNPVGRVPVIDDDGFVLWESNAIVRYLATRHGLGTLMPADLRAQADAGRWMDFQLGTVAAPLSALTWGIVRTAPDKRDPKALSPAFVSLGAALAIVEAGLAGRAYLVGESLTVADIPLACCAHRWFNMPLEGTGLERPDLPNLAAWYGRLKAPPAVAGLMPTPLT